MKRLKKILFWIHLVLGIASGLVIATLAFTGAAMAFEPQILDLVEPNARAVTVQPDAPALTPQQIFDGVKAKYPDRRPGGFVLSSDPTTPVLVQVAGAHAVSVHPQTGDIVSERTPSNFFTVMLLLHIRLSSGEVGGWIVTVSNVFFLLLCITGLYLWWPKTKTALRNVTRFNWKLRSKALHWNLHNVAGFWSLAVLLVITTTGLIMSYQWAGNLLYTLTGSAKPEPAPVVKLADDAPRYPVNDAVARASAIAPGWQTLAVLPPSTRRGTYTLIVREAGAGVELVGSDHRRALAAALAELLDGDVLAEMNEWVREELIDALEPHEVAEIAGELETDDAVALIEDMEEDEQRAVLRALDPDDRAAIEEALSYPEDSAGRLMRRDAVAVPEHWTVGQIIDFLRAGDELTTDFWEVFVVDPAHRPVGTCLLSWILRTPRRIAVADVMKREQTLIPVDMDQEEVALRFQKYALISAAVVDQAGRLVGMITADDVVHIIQEEASEDALLLSGAGTEGDINEPVRDSYKARVRWLAANLVTALVGSSIIALFGAAIHEMVALAVLMPIVASIGGNAGTQTMAVSVRALAMNQLTQSNTWRAIKREIIVALLNGLTIALLIGVGATLVFSSPALGGVIAAAMLLNILIAGLSGVLIPITLERLGQDPAVSSSVFVTMITDSMGFLAFLGLAVASGLVG